VSAFCGVQNSFGPPLTQSGAQSGPALFGGQKRVKEDEVTAPVLAFQVVNYLL
jgi:hypothetical protein